MTNVDNAKDEQVALRKGVKTVASTVAGASIGVVGGIVVITAAAAIEILLPVGLCLWATGLAGGSIGILFGIKKKKEGS